MDKVSLTPAQYNIMQSLAEGGKVKAKSRGGYIYPKVYTFQSDNPQLNGLYACFPCWALLNKRLIKVNSKKYVVLTKLGKLVIDKIAKIKAENPHMCGTNLTFSLKLEKKN